MGEKCVERLSGMFAFAIWDDQKKKLFLARDRIGIKPLYYSIKNNNFAPANSLLGLYLKYFNLNNILKMSIYS